MQQIYLEPFRRVYARLMQQLAYLNHSDKETIAHRLKVMNFFDSFGAKATKAAFNVGRSTVFLWKQKLRSASGRITALAPKSRTPKRKRQRTTHPLVISFTKQYRHDHPGVGKETIKPPLDVYCRQENIKTASTSTIGRVIDDLKQSGKIPVTKKLSFYANSGRLSERRQLPRYRKLRRKDYQPQVPGDLVQVDAITLFANGVRRYLVTAIDLSSRFGFAYSYRTLSSSTATDFLKKFQSIAPFTVTHIQTDNGSEFAKYFREYVQEQKIIHYYNYPRSPKMNAYVERFNRTIQDQYVSWHLTDLVTPASFNVGLIEWLLWYNTEKQHSSLGRLPPLRYYVDTFINQPEKSNMLWTLTGA